MCQVFDGVPPENLYASDLRQDFYDIGYELFADKTTLKCQFIQADIFDENSALVRTLSDKVDIINAASFFHLFSWDQQIVVAKRLVNLLCARPGSLLIGRQAGCIDPVDPDDKENAPRHYRHDSRTWERLWKRVGEETGTEWEVMTWMEPWGGLDQVFKRYHGDVETYKMRFVVRRI